MAFGSAFLKFDSKCDTANQARAANCGTFRYSLRGWFYSKAFLISDFSGPAIAWIPVVSQREMRRAALYPVAKAITVGRRWR
jgi:hypothetical protein